jgi:hypothetical protein
MKTLYLSSSVVIGVTCLASTACLQAATVATQGAGSAVWAPDLVATFDALTSANTTELGNYTEGGLSVTTGSQNWGADPPMAATLDPFHIPGRTDRGFFAMANGTAEWITIQTTNLARMHAVEFLYGNTWTTGNSSVPWGNNDGFVLWQTWSNGTRVSSGQIGPTPMLAVGTVIGFFDPAGFDQLLVKCMIANSSPSNYQALALDDLQVQLTNRPPPPVILPGDFRLDPATGIPTVLVSGALSNCQYRLVYTETLSNAPPTWTAAAAGWQSGSDSLTLTDPAAVGRPHRFYRVEAR